MVIIRIHFPPFLVSVVISEQEQELTTDAGSARLVAEFVGLVVLVTWQKRERVRPELCLSLDGAV